MFFLINFGYKVLQWTNYHELSMINISPIVIYTKNTPTTCKGLTVISPKAVINHKIIVKLHFNDTILRKTTTILEHALM